MSTKMCQRIYIELVLDFSFVSSLPIKSTLKKQTFKEICNFLKLSSWVSPAWIGLVSHGYFQLQDAPLWLPYN